MEEKIIAELYHVAARLCFVQKFLDRQQWLLRSVTFLVDLYRILNRPTVEQVVRIPLIQPLRRDRLLNAHGRILVIRYLGPLVDAIPVSYTHLDVYKRQVNRVRVI